MAGYAALPDGYEWLIPDALLTPAGAVAAFSDLVNSLPPGARVLDCACGTGQLAVDHLDASTFDLVFCVGNSLGHAEGASGRSAALAAMSRLLKPGGRLVLTSRTWELVRAGGSRLDTRDRLIRRNGCDAVVTYYWQIAQRWEQEHNLEIAVAQVEPDGSVRTCSERLSFWPFRYEELVAQLQSVGLEVETTTFNPDADGYLVVAASEQVPVLAEPSR